MRLKNLLEQPGGVSEQGAEITIRVLHTGGNGVLMVRDVAAVLMPVSEKGRAAAEEAARAAVVAKEGLPQGCEEVLQLMRLSLRDPGDLSKLLLEDETDLRIMRAGLIGAQYDQFLDAYQKLIDTEYPDNPTPEQERQLEGEARNFSGGDRPGPG